MDPMQSTGKEGRVAVRRHHRSIVKHALQTAVSQGFEQFGCTGREFWGAYVDRNKKPHHQAIFAVDVGFFTND